MSDTGTGPLVPADDHLNHQIADTFATVGQSDRSWTEKVCATAYARDGSLQLAMGLGKYTNRGVIDAYAGISRGDEQWTVRSSRKLTPDVASSVIGPIHYEIVEPMQTVRFALGENDVVPIRFEWTFTAAVPATMEAREQQRSLGGTHLDADVVRYHQSGTASGWLELEGERVEFDESTWVSTRDHSWGVRYQVGTPLTDLPRGGGGAAAAGGGFSHLTIWMPALLEATDGARFAMHVYHQRNSFGGHHKVETQGGFEHADGRREQFAAVVPELQFDDANRRLLGGVLHVTMGDGSARDLSITPVSDTGFHLGTGLYFGFDGQFHGQWRGKLHVGGEHIGDCKDPEVARRVHQHRDCVVRIEDSVTGAVGWGNAQTIAIGGDPAMGLTDEQSFI